MIPIAIIGFLAQWWRVIAMASLLGSAAFAAHRYIKARETAAVNAAVLPYQTAAAASAKRALEIVKRQERDIEQAEAKHQGDVVRLNEYYARRLRDAGRSGGARVPAPAAGASAPAPAPAEPSAAGACDPEIERRAALDALTVLEWQEFYESLRRDPK